MLAIAVFNRQSFSGPNNTRTFILPVLVEVSKNPMEVGFDYHDYHGAAWMAVKPVEVSDPNGILPENCSSPTLDFITEYDESIPLDNWIEVDSTIKRELIHRHISKLFSKEVFLRESRATISDSIGYEISMVDGELDFKVSCDGASAKDLKTLHFAIERFERFLRGEHYSAYQNASVNKEFLMRATGGSQ